MSSCPWKSSMNSWVTIFQNVLERREGKFGVQSQAWLYLFLMEQSKEMNRLKCLVAKWGMNNANKEKCAAIKIGKWGKMRNKQRK